MENKYVVNLERNEKSEIYEENDNNVLKVRVILPNKEIVSNQSYIVELSLSRNAKLGLGTELIREALNEPYENTFSEIEPITKTNICMSKGIYLHPESCKLLVASYEHETVEELLNNS